MFGVILSTRGLKGFVIAALIIIRPWNSLDAEEATFRHQYTPEGGGNSLSLPYTSDSACFNKEFAVLLDRKIDDWAGNEDEHEHSGGPPSFGVEDFRPGGWLEYVLLTGGNWKGPIREFNLKVTGANYLGVCFEGEKYSARKEVNIQRRDFTPTADLRIDYAGR